MKKFLSIGLLALTLTASAHAAQVFVRFGPPPPPPRQVMVMRPGPRHVWLPGYYRWQGNRYSWVNGYWAVPPRHRAAWVPGQWMPQRGGYVWMNGYWH